MTEIIAPTRRGFIQGLVLLLAAPAVLRIITPMKLAVVPELILPSSPVILDSYAERVLTPMIREIHTVVAKDIMTELGTDGWGWLNNLGAVPMKVILRNEPDLVQKLAARIGENKHRYLNHKPLSWFNPDGTIKA